MATQQYKAGRNFAVYDSGRLVGCAKTNTFELTTSLSDSTTNCDVVGGVLWANQTPQKNSFKVTVNGMIPALASGATPTKDSARQLTALQIAQTRLYVTFVDTATNEVMGGDAYITSVKTTAETETDATFDVTFDGTGPLSLIAVS